MSEIHTSSSELSDYEDLYTSAQADRYEREANNLRLERELDANKVQLEVIESNFKRQNKHVEQVISGLNSQIKGQELKYKNKLTDLRKEQIVNLRSINKSFENKIEKLAQNTKSEISTLKKETKTLVLQVRKELNQEVNEQNKKIEALSDIVREVFDANIQAERLSVDWYNDLLHLYNNEMANDLSLFKKISYSLQGISFLTDFKTKLDAIKSRIDQNQHTLALGAAQDLYWDFYLARLRVESQHEAIMQRYRNLLANYEALIKMAESNTKTKIKGVNIPQLSFDTNNKKWKGEDEKIEIEIEVNEFTNGELIAFVERLKPDFEKRNKPEIERNHRITEEWLDKFENKISGDENSYQAEYDNILKKAKQIALNSHIREVLAAKTELRFKQIYPATCSTDGCQKGFELGDRKKAFHLQLRIDGEKRHFVFAPDDENLNQIYNTMLEGEDHATHGNSGLFDDNITQQNSILNESGIGLTQLETISKSDTNLCQKVGDFIGKGLTKEQKEILTKN